MNDQLALADPFWTGATQLMVFQQNFWTPDNTVGATPGALNYGDTFTFSGNVLVSEAYASGNVGEVFVQFLDKSFNATFQDITDITTLPIDGSFSITTLIPADADLNIIQVGFRNGGIEGTAGEMTFSNLSVAMVPEPSAFGLIGGLIALGFIARRRR